MRRSLAAAFAVALGGCNLVFGLEPPAGGDDDDDGGGDGDGGASDGGGVDASSGFTDPVMIELLGPEALAVGQIDGAGGQDLAVTSPGSSSVAIITCDDLGVCQRIALGAGSQPSSLALLDANRDGNLDLAVAATGGDVINVMFGVGDGDFVAGPSIAAATPNAVVAGTFIGLDNAPDLIVAHAGSPTMNVYTNNLSGGFAIGSTVTGPQNITGLLTGELVDDAQTELVVIDDGAVQPYQVGMTGGFTTINGFTGTASDVLITDVNADQLGDLLIARSSGALSVWLGNGQGSFQASPQATLAIDAGTLSLASGDANGDGRADVVVASRETGAVMIFLSDRDGNLTATTTLPAGGGPSDVALTDVDDNGRDDLVVLQATANQVLIYFARP